MNPDVEEIRQGMSTLLAATRRETQQSFSGVEMDWSVQDDQAGWRVRDVLGHLGVWNGEAAKSLLAFAEGGEYHCIPSEEKYDEYNAHAVDERRSWDIQQVWDEYEASADQLKVLVDSLPVVAWNRIMLYPWNERGVVRNLIEVMMQHEIEHRQWVSHAIAQIPSPTA